MKYGGYDGFAAADPTKAQHQTQANQPIYYPQGQPGVFQGMPGGFNPQAMQQPLPQQQQHQHDFMNNSFSGKPPHQQQQPAPLPIAMPGVGALPTLSNTSPNRNQNQLDEYKKELMLQIEEKKKREEDVKKKIQQEDEREEMRLKREQEELNRRYQQEAYPGANSNKDSQKDNSNNYDEQQQPASGHPRDHRGESNKGSFQKNYDDSNRHGKNNNYRNDDYQQQPSGHFSEYHTDTVRHGQQHNNYDNRERISKQQSRKIRVQHGLIDFNNENNVGPDSYPEMYNSHQQYEDEQQPPPPQHNMMHQQHHHHHQQHQQHSSPRMYPPEQQQQHHEHNTPHMGPPPQQHLQHHEQPPMDYNMFNGPQPLQQQLMQQQHPPEFEPFKKQLQQQLQHFQKDIQKLQYQQKLMMKNYQKEIEQLQNKKQQIITDMKSDQDVQMKLQINHLSHAIEQLTRKMNKQDYSSPPPPMMMGGSYHHKNEIVAEILQEIKNVLPLQFQHQQYSHSQSPPPHQSNFGHQHHHQQPVSASHQFEHQIIDVSKYQQSHQQQPPPKFQLHNVKTESHHQRAPSYPPSFVPARPPADQYHSLPNHPTANQHPPQLPHQHQHHHHNELPSTTALIPSKFPEFEPHHIVEHFHDPHRQSNESHQHRYDKPPADLGQIREDVVREEIGATHQHIPSKKSVSIEEPKAIMPGHVTRASQYSLPSKHSVHQSNGSQLPQSLKRQLSPQEDETLFEPQPVADMHVEIPARRSHEVMSRSPSQEKLKHLPSITSMVQNSVQEHHSPRDIVNPLLSQRIEYEDQQQPVAEPSPRPQYNENTPGPIKLRNQANKKEQKPPVHPGQQTRAQLNSTIKPPSSSPQTKKPGMPKGKSEANLLSGRKPPIAAQVDQKSRGGAATHQASNPSIDDHRKKSPPTTAHPTPVQQQHFGFKGGKNLSPEALNDSNASIRPGSRSGIHPPTAVPHGDRPTTSQLQSKFGQRPTTSQQNHQSPQHLKDSQWKSMNDVRGGQGALHGTNARNVVPATQQRPTTSQHSAKVGGGKPTTSQQHAIGGGRPTTSQSSSLGGRPTTSQHDVGRGGPQSQGRSQIASSQVLSQQQPRAVPVIVEETEPEVEIDHSSLDGNDHHNLALEQQINELSEVMTDHAMFLAQDSIHRNEVEKERQRLQEEYRLEESDRQRKQQEERVERERHERDRIRQEQDTRERMQRQREEALENERQRIEQERMDIERKDRERKQREEHDLKLRDEHDRKLRQDQERRFKEEKDSVLKEANQRRAREENERRQREEQDKRDKEKKERDVRLRLAKTDQDFEKLSGAMADQAMNAALESVERMQQQQMMHRDDKIVIDTSFNMT